MAVLASPRMSASVIPTFADVEAAARRLAGVAVLTPLVESPLLSDRLGARAYLKLETLQRTGSVKFRGAYNRLSQLTPEQRNAGVVAFSSGNHAQGVAAAAKLLGIPATIVMPADAPRIKMENTRSYGAQIVPYDRRRESREEIAGKLARDKGAMVVPSFDDPAIVAGQGSCGLEIAAQGRALGVTFDNVLAPASGCGLISGIALALSGASPGTRAIACEPEGYDGLRLSLSAGQRMAAAGKRETIADALMSPAPGHIPFAILKEQKAVAVAVSDDALMQAVGFAARELKLVVEPGGAAALAAVLSRTCETRGKTIAVVLSGGNIDSAMLVRCLDATQR